MNWYISVNLSGEMRFLFISYAMVRQTACWVCGLGVRERM